MEGGDHFTNHSGKQSRERYLITLCTGMYYVDCQYIHVRMYWCVFHGLASIDPANATCKKEMGFTQHTLLRIIYTTMTFTIIS